VDAIAAALSPLIPVAALLGMDVSTLPRDLVALLDGAASPAQQLRICSAAASYPLAFPRLLAAALAVADDGDDATCSRCAIGGMRLLTSLTVGVAPPHRLPSNHVDPLSLSSAWGVVRQRVTACCLPTLPRCALSSGSCGARQRLLVARPGGAWVTTSTDNLGVTAGQGHLRLPSLATIRAVCSHVAYSVRAIAVSRPAEVRAVVNLLVPLELCWFHASAVMGATLALKGPSVSAEGRDAVVVEREDGGHASRAKRLRLTSEDSAVGLEMHGDASLEALRGETGQPIHASSALPIATKDGCPAGWSLPHFASGAAAALLVALWWSVAAATVGPATRVASTDDRTPAARACGLRPRARSTTVARPAGNPAGGATCDSSLPACLPLSSLRSSGRCDIPMGADAGADEAVCDSTSPRMEQPAWLQVLTHTASQHSHTLPPPPPSALVQALRVLCPSGTCAGVTCAGPSAPSPCSCPPGVTCPLQAFDSLLPAIQDVVATVATPAAAQPSCADVVQPVRLAPHAAQSPPPFLVHEVLGFLLPAAPTSPRSSAGLSEWMTCDDAALVGVVGRKRPRTGAYLSKHLTVAERDRRRGVWFRVHYTGVIAGNLARVAGAWRSGVSSHPRWRDDVVTVSGTAQQKVASARADKGGAAPSTIPACDAYGVWQRAAAALGRAVGDRLVV